VVVEKRHDVIQGGLRSLSIHGSRIITAVDPVLTLPFELVHPFAQEAQRCELVPATLVFAPHPCKDPGKSRG
jgi:hypothetical protein